MSEIGPSPFWSALQLGDCSSGFVAVGRTGLLGLRIEAGLNRVALAVGLRAVFGVQRHGARRVDRVPESRNLAEPFRCFLAEYLYLITGYLPTWQVRAHAWPCPVPERAKQGAY